LTYILSIIKLFYALTSKFLFQKSKCYFLIVDFECNIAAILLKSKKNKIISLINDNFSIRYKFPKILFLIIRHIESLTYFFVSDFCIFPDICRVNLLGNILPKKYFIIPNVLNDNYKIKYIGNSDKDLKVLMCGWLESTRGFDILKSILINTNEQVNFVLTGSGNYILKNPEIIDNRRIKYLGHLSREENLNLMSTVDINFCFYNPKILINRYALPQKINDSILISCPIFINSEVEMSKNLEINKVAISAKYFDIDDICNKLNLLLNDKSQIREMNSNFKNYKQNLQTYDEIKSSAINFYKDILRNKV